MAVGVPFCPTPETLAAGSPALRSYQSAWLRHDIVAGLVLTTMLVPVGIAYAVASGVPVVSAEPCRRQPLSRDPPGGLGGLRGPDSMSRPCTPDSVEVSHY